MTSSNDGVLGGETVFYPHDRKSAKEELVIAPETGMLLLHKHGDNCLLVSFGSQFWASRRHAVSLVLTKFMSISTRVAKSKLVKSGLFEQIYVSVDKVPMHMWMIRI